MFPLQITEEVYYAGMGEHEVRYVLSTSDGRVIARDDYLKIALVDELNKFVDELKE